ncbi:MAG: hypothetical protein HY900_04320 [Deltaproteobacteria bacterium]|nr:hypothetical protein [Deltaproteobacteria bacterium]
MFEWVRKLFGEKKGGRETDTGVKASEHTETRVSEPVETTNLERVETGEPKRTKATYPESAKTEEGKPSPAPAPRPKRDFHLGLDWGTSTTKLVLRDYSQGDQGLAYVLCFDGAEGGYRYPSAVAVRDGRIHLGPNADRKGGGLYSLKALAIGGQVGALVPGSTNLSYEDLATLYLAHVLNRAWSQTAALADRVGAEPRLGVTLGVPTDVSWSRFAQAGTYLRMVRTAYQLGVRESLDPQGFSEAEGLSAVEGARTRVTQSADFDTWLRPELAAATLWGFRSPAIEPGLYSCVDVGAWTANTSFFRIRHEVVDGDYQEKGGLGFFGGACRPPAMNDLCSLLASKAGVAPETLRGSENDAVERFGRGVAEPVLARIFETWRLGFHNSYGHEARQEAWRHLRVLPIGGGSKVDAVRQLLTRFPLPGWDPPRLEPDLGCPRDLFNLPRPRQANREAFSGDSAFLLVAYGLSVRYGDFPPMRLADEIQPLPSIGQEHQRKDQAPRAGMCQQCGERRPMLGDTVCRDCGG